jgi:glycosyltransferase involved in cell wall biosynthesis
MGSAADITYVGFVLGHGGDALQMLRLASAADATGRSVRLIVPELDESVTFAARSSELGLPCVRTPLIAAGWHAPRQRFRSMIELFRSIDSPIVHIHTGNSLLPRSTMAALELLRYRPAFVTVQSPYESVEPGSMRARIWAATVNRRVATLISPSHHGARFQVSLGIDADRVVTIPNTFDSTLAHGDGSAPRRELGIDESVPLVVFTSRVSQQKRPVDAVRIFAEGTRGHPDARFAIVGDGDQRDAVEAEIERLGLSDRVVLIGYRTDVQDWLAAATAWLLPTERENFSLAVLEALSAGCAVVSTDAPGNDEILVDDVNALTFGVGDVKAGAAALARLLDDPGLRRRLGQRGREDVSAYSLDEMLARHLAVYDAVDNGPRRRRG